MAARAAREPKGSCFCRAFLGSGVDGPHLLARLVDARGFWWAYAEIESFNGKRRDVWLDRGIFTTPKETHVLFEAWQRHSNPERPYSSLNDYPPAPKALPVRPLPVMAPRLTGRVVQPLGGRPLRPPFRSPSTQLYPRCIPAGDQPYRLLVLNGASHPF